jgi:hypothetical protein
MPFCVPPKCHPKRNPAGKGLCFACRRKADPTWYARKLELSREKYHRNPAKYNASNHRWYVKNKDRVKRAHARWIKRNYSKWRRSVNSYIARKKEQLSTRPKPDHCEVCFTPGKVMFDHDHSSGKFRGWLCRDCNLVLGFTKDNPDVLRKLAKYLEDNR